MANISNYKIHALLVILLMTLSSCSGSSAPDPDKESDAKEIKAKTKSSLDLPEHELFSNAKRQYQSGLYSVARDSFTAIKDNYPTGPFAEFSELKIADTQYENRDYHAAALAYEEFTKNRPASNALPYAYLRTGRSYELSSAGVGRDPTPLNKAIESYTALIERFPNSVYTSAGRYYKHGVEELLAAYAQEVIAFYEDKSKSSAASAREKDFEKKYGSNSTEFEAAKYDKRASLAVGPVSEDKIRQAKQILKSLPALSAARSITQTSAETEKLRPPEGKFIVNSVSCDPHEKLVVLTFDPKPQNAVTGLNAVKRGDSIELRITDLTTVGEETKAYTCFSEGDMTISSNGLLTLRVETEGATALYIDNPARVILNIQK